MLHYLFNYLFIFFIVHQFPILYTFTLNIDVINLIFDRLENFQMAEACNYAMLNSITRQYCSIEMYVYTSCCGFLFHGSSLSHTAVRYESYP